jgi:hypothetical protein
MDDLGKRLGLFVCYDNSDIETFMMNNGCVVSAPAPRA